MAPAALPFSPAADRNKGPILAVLRQVLAPQARVLEIASGTGQHAAHFAEAGTGWAWQPTEVQSDALAAIAERCRRWPQVLPPRALDVAWRDWPLDPDAFDALYCANLLHISPWSTCAALMQGARRHLVSGGALVLYGPWRVEGEPLAPGNQAFDADLRARDAQWGLRSLSAVVEAATDAGLRFDRRVDMPANNLMLVFLRGGPTSR